MAQQEQEFELKANWGNIALVACALPPVGLFLLNPISLFLWACAAFWGLVLTFFPKLVYLLLLEFEIARGRGSEFYHRHHARTVRANASLSVQYLISLTVLAAGILGGVESISRQQVANVRKVNEQPLEMSQIQSRVIKLPMILFRCLRAHTHAFFSALSYNIMRAIALGVVAKLYTKTRRVPLGNASSGTQNRR